MATQNEIKLIISGDTARAQQAIAAVNRGLAGFSAMIPGLNSSLARLGTAVVAAFSFNQVVGNINRVIHTATDINNLADEFGLSAKAVSALRFQFEKLGESPEKFDAAFRTFSKAITEALDPTSKMAQLFKAMGVSVRDAGGNIRSTEDILKDTGNSLSQYEHNAKFAALATELFGRSGVKFADVLGSQPDLIARNSAELSKFSDSLDPGALAQYNEALATVKKAYDGIWKTAAAGLLPTLSNLAKAFSDSSITGGDLKLIGDGIAAVFKVAATAATALYSAIKFVGRELGSLYEMSRQVLRGDFGAAKEAAKDYLYRNAFDVGDEALAQMEAIWAKAEKGTAKKSEGGTKTAPGTGDFGENAFQMSADALQAMRGASIDLVKIDQTRNVLADQRARFAITESEYFQELRALSQEQFRAETTLLNLKQLEVDAVADGVEHDKRQLQIDIERLKIANEKADRDRQIASEQRASTWAGGIDKFREFVETGASQANYVAGILTNTVGGAITGISDGIMGMIDGTKSWGQAWLQVGKQVLASLIQLTTQLIVMQMIQATLGIFGLALSGGGLPSIIAKADGGLIPGTPSATDNRLAMVATGEYVVNSAAVQHYGHGLLDAINNMALPQGALGNHGSVGPAVHSPGFATGGRVGSGAGLQVAFLNSRPDMREFMAREGWKYIIDPLTKRGVRVG